MSKKSERKIHYLILGLILFFGLVLRLWNIGEHSQWVDEPQVFVAAQSILETGKPYFHSGYLYTRDLPHLYTVAATMYIFGENDVAMRLVSVFAGLGIIILCFLITRSIWHPYAGYIAAAMASFHPWLVSYSRIGRSYIMMVFFLLLTLYAILLYLERDKAKYLVLAAIAGIIAIMTHQTGQTVLLFSIPMLCTIRILERPLKKLITVGLVFGTMFAGLLISKYFTALAYYQAADQKVEYIRQSFSGFEKLLNHVPIQFVPDLSNLFFVRYPAFGPFLLTIVLIVTGLYMYRILNKQQKFILLTGIIFLTILIFSKKTVRVNRGVLYIAPILYVFFSIGIYEIAKYLRAFHKYVAAIFLVAVFGLYSFQSVKQVTAVTGDSIDANHSFFEGINYRVDMRSTFEYVAQHMNPEDQVIVMGSPKFAAPYMDGIVPDYYVWMGTQITIDNGYHYVVKTKLIDNFDELQNTVDKKNTWIITTYSISNLKRIGHIGGRTRGWINRQNGNQVYQSSDPYARVYYFPKSE